MACSTPVWSKIRLAAWPVRRWSPPGLVVIAGEITTEAFCDFQKVARMVIREVGYLDASMGIGADQCAVMVTIDEQSPDIAQGVDENQRRARTLGPAIRG